MSIRGYIKLLHRVTFSNTPPYVPPFPPSLTVTKHHCPRNTSSGLLNCRLPTPVVASRVCSRYIIHVCIQHITYVTITCGEMSLILIAGTVSNPYLCQEISIPPFSSCCYCLVAYQNQYLLFTNNAAAASSISSFASLGECLYTHIHS